MRDKRGSKENSGKPDNIPLRSLDRLDDDTIVRAYLEPERTKRPKRPWWTKWFPWLSDLWGDD